MLVVYIVVGAVVAFALYRRRLDAHDRARWHASSCGWRRPCSSAARRAARLIERNVMVYRRIWMILVSGFFEPLFYLLSIGVGIGKLVGDVTLPDGQAIEYTAFVAPALLASSAMNGAVYESTMNVFDKLKWRKIYDAILATPVGAGDIALGEIGWALLRGPDLRHRLPRRDGWRWAWCSRRGRSSRCPRLR